MRRVPEADRRVAETSAPRRVVDSEALAPITADLSVGGLWALELTLWANKAGGAPTTLSQHIASSVVLARLGAHRLALGAGSLAADPIPVLVACAVAESCGADAVSATCSLPIESRTRPALRTPVKGTRGIRALGAASVAVGACPTVEALARSVSGEAIKACAVDTEAALHAACVEVVLRAIVAFLARPMASQIVRVARALSCPSDAIAALAVKGTRRAAPTRAGFDAVRAPEVRRALEAHAAFHFASGPKASLKVLVTDAAPRRPL